MTETFISIDGGKSALRLLAVTGSRRQSGTGPGMSYLPGEDGVERTVAAVRAAAAGLELPDRVAGIVAGLTAVPGEPGPRRELARRIGAELRGPALVAEDVHLAHAGALAGPGTVLCLGTGTNVLAMGAGGEYTTVEGWGPALGDRGSGYAIGLAGLRAATAALDGVGPDTVLTERFPDAVGGAGEAGRLPEAVGGPGSAAGRAGAVDGAGLAERGAAAVGADAGGAGRADAVDAGPLERGAGAVGGGGSAAGRRTGAVGGVGLAALQRFYRDPELVARIAGFAPVVVEAAGRDAVARAICAAAVDDLVALAASAARRQPDAGPRVSWSGRLLGSGGPLLDRLDDGLREHGLEPVAPAGSSLDGGLTLLRGGAPYIRVVERLRDQVREHG